MTAETVLGWWCPSRERLWTAPPRAGLVERHTGVLEVGRAGLHASPTVVDALAFGETPIACRVELAGEVRRGVGQLCANTRRVLWLADARRAIARVVGGEAERLGEIASRAPGARAETWSRIAARDAGADAPAVDRARQELELADERFRDAEWRSAGRPTDEIAVARRDADLARAVVALAEARGFDAPTLLDYARPLERLADAIAWAEPRGVGGFETARGRARAILTGALALALERERAEALPSQVLEELAREPADQSPETTTLDTPVHFHPSPASEALSAFVLGLPAVAAPPTPGHVPLPRSSSSVPRSSSSVTRAAPSPPRRLLVDDEAPPPRWSVFCVECSGRFGRDDRPFYVSDPCPGCAKSGWLVELEG